MPIFKTFQRPSKTYRYNLHNIHKNFVINAIENQTGYYSMTAQGACIQPGDYIEIAKSEQCAKY